MAEPDDALLAVAEELYGLDPADFTAARNDRVAALRTEDRALSDRVKELRKPTSAAWVVNLLVRHEPDQMAQMLDVGEALRQAAADLDADTMRELTRQRRRLINVVAGEGRRLARELGTRISEQVLRQVEDTLHAAMIDADAAAAVRTGLLLDALSPAGVGSLKLATAVADHTALGRGSAATPRGGSAASTGRGPARAGASRTDRRSGPAGSSRRALSAVPERDPAEVERERQEEERRRRAEQRAAAQAAVDEAAADADAADEQVAVQQQQVADLQASALQLNGEIDELRRRIAELEDRLETVDEKLDDATAAEAEASGRAAEARAAHDRARAALEELGDG